MLPHHHLRQHIANRHAEEVIFFVIEPHAVREPTIHFRLTQALIRSFCRGHHEKGGIDELVSKTVPRILEAKPRA